ncbi:double-strand break repair protein AddB [Novosphingobium sp. ZN18A2]|uniref:double-strand break repair protein AddB n=1 Tax=Novosphingobium sp. ZN18A2 TaxID=3079861 RepID=UPI0030CB7C86
MDVSRQRPSVYSIAAHRGFADALVAGLIPRYREDRFGLARLTLLLPSRRTARTVTEAFVRASDGGLLLPRMAVVGDLDIDETLGPLLDPIGAGAGIPPACDPAFRLLRVAQFLKEEMGDEAPGESALLRQARSIVRSMDRLSVEDVPPSRLLDLDLGDLAEHWMDSLRTFARVQARWAIELDVRGEVDPPERRNRLLDHAAKAWREAPPPHPVVAAGVTSASPAVARLLRSIADLESGAVILPDLDLSMPDEVWDSLGNAGAPAGEGEPPFARGDAVTHPQYHLKLLLNRMGLARGEVQPWHRSGVSPARPERSRAISNLFLPPEASAVWAELSAEDRRLSGVRLMKCAHPEEEAQSIAILAREALVVPEKRVAVVTPDRNLAARVVALLSRWNIVADDSAGRPLPQTPAGRLLLHLSEVLAEHAAPVPLLALLGHPLVRADGRRAAWLDHVRQLDLALRGPRPGPGLAGVRDHLRGTGIARRFPQLAQWWDEPATALSPLFQRTDDVTLGEWLALLAEVAEDLCGEALWSRPDGRALAQFIEQWSLAAANARLAVRPAELPALLRDALDEVAVRPPWGGHPRLAIYGLLEARMSRADLVICGGMAEGVWPGVPSVDPLLAPAVLRALGIPGADFRIGLAAHDLAAALGAPEVVLSHAARDAEGPAIPSRFLLRIRAMLGDRASKAHEETRAVALAGAIDDAPQSAPYPQPMPMPSAEQRRVDIAVTALDRLRGDPYQFYAASILRLKTLDPLDSDPTPAWRGMAVHEILQLWHEAGTPPGELIPLAERKLAEMSTHPFMAALWRPRLVNALAWVEEHTDALLGQGRKPALWEQWGDIRVDGIKVFGRADRIDRLEDGSLAIVDYKTGMPPSARMVREGFSLQLGLIGLIAREGGFRDLSGDPVAFEYWSMARNKARGFGYVASPVKTANNRAELMPEDFVPITGEYLREAIARWILGEEPFTARLNPDLPGYTDYDQLMRLDEWQGRSRRNDGEEGASGDAA